MKLGSGLCDVISQIVILILGLILALVWNQSWTVARIVVIHLPWDVDVLIRLVVPC